MNAELHAAREVWHHDQFGCAQMVSREPAMKLSVEMLGNLRELVFSGVPELGSQFGALTRERSGFELRLCLVPGVQANF